MCTPGETLRQKQTKSIFLKTQKRSFLSYIFFYGNKLACLIKLTSTESSFKMLDPSYIGVKPFKSPKTNLTIAHPYLMYIRLEGTPD